MVTILIVEDDINIAKMIEMTISMGGYKSQTTHNGKEALDICAHQEFDVILLDVMLPDMDGFQIMEHLSHTKAQVIFLTAKTDVADKVKGLRLGAQDYISKPFEPLELLARIEVVLRRHGTRQENISYKHINVDIGKHIASSFGEAVALTPKEFDVLVFFLEHIDLAITKEKLMSFVWGYDFAGETRTVDIHVQQVRRKMQLQDMLITIPKLGYRLES